MMVKARRQVKRVSMMSKARWREDTQGAQFRKLLRNKTSYLFLILLLHYACLRKR